MAQRGRITPAMAATDLLYLTDAYLRSFPARVVDVDAEGHRVALDRTAFYPTGGGQPHDTGTIDGRAVQADGGTHVASTSEVGRIRVTKTESKGKGNKRIRLEVLDG
jgi:Ser-tRNA(Ala) deacylase AlaX